MEYAEGNNYISLFCFTELSGPGFPVSNESRHQLFKICQVLFKFNISRNRTRQTEQADKEVNIK